jgi:hypothetical protein
VIGRVEPDQGTGERRNQFADRLVEAKLAFGNQQHRRHAGERLGQGRETPDGVFVDPGRIVETKGSAGNIDRWRSALSDRDHGAREFPLRHPPVDHRLGRCNPFGADGGERRQR